MPIDQTLAFIFPGQGSQAVGMLSALAEKYSVVQETFKEASDVLGYDAWALAQDGPEEQLNQTEFTQPVLLAADIAVWRVWQMLEGQTPAFLAGHSLGEFAALVAAESLQFKDAVNLVALRGKYMQAATAEGAGAMGAIVGLDNTEVIEICKEAARNDVLSPANYNSVGQVVVAGDTAAVERALSLAKTRGAKMAKMLPVSVPSHCPLMTSAVAHLSAAMGEVGIKAPQLPVIHNANVSVSETPDEIRQVLAEQLVQPVRWVEIIQAMEKLGVTRVAECGPGKVLFGLLKRITKSITPMRLDSPESIEGAVKGL